MSHQHKFVTLDAIRGIAAMLVLTRHTSAYWGGVNFHHAYLAVDLFFMLSGFVISHAYDRKLTSKTMSFWRFLLTRIIRLYPLYLFAAILSALVFAPKKAFIQCDTDVVFDYLGALFLNLLYLPAKLDSSNSLFPINGVCWSLFFELLVNIVYALFRRFLSTKNLILVMCLSCCYLIYQAIFIGSIDYGFLWDWKSLTIGGARTVFGFSCGLLIHRAYLKQPTIERSTAKSALLIFVASVPLLFPDIEESNALIDCLGFLVIFPFCVLSAARINPQTTGFRIYELLGVISYPIYLLHDSMGTGILRVLKFVGFDVKQFAPVSGFMLVAGLVVFTLLLDRFYDHPIRRYLSTIAFGRELGKPDRPISINS